MFRNFFKKYKNSLKTVAFAALVFLAVFAVLYFRTSWNTKPVLEKASYAQSSFAETISVDNQSLADAAGISLAEFNEWAKKYGLTGKNANLSADPDGDGLENSAEYIHGTDPKKSDSDGDGFTDLQEIQNGYDPAAPGDARPTVEISLEKISVAAPMVWSKSENDKDQLADLQHGVAHFSKTAAPGQKGNMIISGHSSNYIWAKGDFNYIFQNLNNLSPGDLVDVKTVQQNGKVIVYQYKVVEKFTTIPNDARIFEETGLPMITLSTCWPVGSSARRLIVRGELVN